MKAVRIHAHGGRDVLRWEDCPPPQPAENQVLVEIKAAALNHLDLWVRGGLPGVPLPIIMGSDGAGVVREVGREVTGFKSGDKVLVQPLIWCGNCRFCRQGRENYCRHFGILGRSADGTQAEFVVLEEQNLRLKPDRISFEAAAAFPLVAQTAYTMLISRAGLEAGETVLVWGAGSGVGSMAVQIARWRGARVIATGGTRSKLDLAQELGAEAVVNYTREDVPERINAFTDGQGVDVIFEHVGAATWGTSLRCLGKGGRLVTCGATSGSQVSLNLRHLYYKQQSILGSTMGAVGALDECIRLVAEGKLKPVVDRSFPMAAVSQAHQYLEQHKQLGKVILVP